jgi:hypothetical protein
MTPRHAPTHPLRLLAAATAAALVAPFAHGQFYEKVDPARAAEDAVVSAVSGRNPSLGAQVATLARCGDPGVERLFRAMASSADPAARVYGVLGAALVGTKGIDPALFAALGSQDERSAVVREANVSGLLRSSPVAELMAVPGLQPAATLTLAGELDRRREPWDRALVVPIATGDDAVAAGVASLLLGEPAPGGAAGDPAPWRAFESRLGAMPAPEREATLRALVEAALMFEVHSACVPLLTRCTADGMPESLQLPAIGMALRLEPTAGLAAWKARVARERSQVALVRAGLQLLASVDHGVPPDAFDAIRNGNAVLDSIADAGAALARKEPPAPAIVRLLDSGHPGSAEWALIRAAELPPDQGAPVWRHVLAQLDGTDPLERPSGVLVAGLVRELIDTDAAEVARLAERLDGDDALEAALMSGLWDSRSPAAAPIARARRGTLPRMGESLAVLVLSAAGGTLTDDDLQVLARAASGGGDLDPARAVQAAWHYARATGGTDRAVARVASAAAAAEGN